MTDVLTHSNYDSDTAQQTTQNVYNSILKKSASFFSKPTFLSSLPPANELKPWQHPIGNCSPEEIIAHRVKTLKDLDGEDPFYVADLGEIARQQMTFKTLLPRVEPFYAVKCNPDPMVIRALKKLGTGFDCASKGEIQMVMDQGVQPHQIIYANPCKQASHLKFARDSGVRMMTFDNADELRKIKVHCPEAELVLRILTDDSKSICKLGTKFGASFERVPGLLKTAKELDMNVIGVSFHVGSGCLDPQAFGDAVILARKVFDLAKTDYGFEFNLLDVGGGFPGRNAKGVQFKDIAEILRRTLDEYFPENIRIIAEPGRYYVCSAFTLVVNVVARRVVENQNPQSQPQYMYYINDGMYGSFNCITFDHAEVEATPLTIQGQYVYHQTLSENLPHAKCSIWGPTCDSIDCIGKEIDFPVVEVGDFIAFEDMGAYTMCAASQFNGFKKTVVMYTNTEVGLEVLLME